MNNSKRVKCYVKNGGSSKQCLLNGVQKNIKSSNSRQSANTRFPVNFENFSFHTSGNYWGNSTLTKTKQHHAQSKSPASTPSSTSKKKQNRNSEETIQELLLHIRKLEKKVERLSALMASL